MAIALDTGSSFPVTSQNGNFTTTKITSPTFSTSGPDGVLLVAMVGWDGGNVIQPASVNWSDSAGNTVSNPSGASGWSQRVHAEWTGGGSVGMGSSQIWTAWVSPGFTLSGVYATAARAAGTSAGAVLLAVYALKGASEYFGGSGTREDGTGTAVPVDATLTAIAKNSWVIGIAMTGGTSAALTARANTTINYQFNNAALGDSIAVFRTGALSGPGSITVGCTNSSGFTTVSALEILEAAPKATVLLPERHRPRWNPERSSSSWPPFTPPTVVAPFVPAAPQIRPTPRWNPERSFRTSPLVTPSGCDESLGFILGNPLGGTCAPPPNSYAPVLPPRIQGRWALSPSATVSPLYVITVPAPSLWSVELPQFFLRSRWNPGRSSTDRPTHTQPPPPPPPPAASFAPVLPPSFIRYSWQPERSWTVFPDSKGPTESFTMMAISVNEVQINEVFMVWLTYVNVSHRRVRISNVLPASVPSSATTFGEVRHPSITGCGYATIGTEGAVIIDPGRSVTFFWEGVAFIPGIYQILAATVDLDGSYLYPASPVPLTVTGV